MVEKKVLTLDMRESTASGGLVLSRLNVACRISGAMRGGKQERNRSEREEEKRQTDKERSQNRTKRAHSQNGWVI